MLSSGVLSHMQGTLGWESSYLYSSGTLLVIPEPTTLPSLALGMLLAWRRRRGGWWLECCVHAAPGRDQWPGRQFTNIAALLHVPKTTAFCPNLRPHWIASGRDMPRTRKLGSGGHLTSSPTPWPHFDSALQGSLNRYPCGSSGSGAVCDNRSSGC